jgi:four helix bundle protein
MSTTAPDYTQRTFAFACDVVEFYRAIVKVPHFPFGIARQVLRSGTSIGANLEEARVPTTRRDLKNKFKLALKEARETKYWLRLIRATKLAPDELSDRLLHECDQLVAILTVSVRNLAG